MYKNLRWKILTIVVVFVVFFGIGVYPLLASRYHLPPPQWLMDHQLRLGLDLKGGVHLLLHVNPGDALKVTTTATSEQLRESLRTANVPVTSITVDGPMKFRVEGVPPDRDAEFRRAADEIAAANFDRNPGANGTYEFTLKPLV